MASFNEDGLKKKLIDLNMSQQSIQTMALWLIHHKKHAHSIVNIWFKELVKAQNGKKLAFMYLANDVIQNSKKKGPEYSKEFAYRLPKAFKHLSTVNLEEKQLRGVKRLLNVWEERGIFDSQIIKDFKKKLASGAEDQEDQSIKRSGIEDNSVPTKKQRKNETNNDENFPGGTLELGITKAEEHNQELSPIGGLVIHSALKAPTPTSTATTATASKPCPEPEQLIQALQELENAATADAEVRKKIAGLPTAVSDISGLSKLRDVSMGRDLEAQVDEALEILDVYNKRLAQEMEARKSVARLLHDYISHQKDILSQAEETLEEHRIKFNQVQKVRQELKAHLQNLPDISKLPNLGGGLAPLPSAGDLFT